MPNDIEHHTIKKTESHTVIKPKYDDKQLKPGNTRNQSHTHTLNKTLNDGRVNIKHKNTEEKRHFITILA